jgi:hypothetical protein
MLAIAPQNDFPPGYISGYEIAAAVIYHVFWLFWLYLWFITFDYECFLDSVHSRHPFLKIYMVLFGIVTGFGLTAKGRVIRRMLGIGLLCFFLPSLVLRFTHL